MRIRKVLDRIPRPPGAIPAKAQTWVLASLTAVIVIALLAFPGQPPDPAGAGPADDYPAEGGQASPPDLASVEGAARRIRDGAHRDAELRMRGSLGIEPPSPDGLPPPPGELGASPPAGDHADDYPPPPSVEDRIREQERLRLYESLQAPVLVQTARVEQNQGTAPDADVPSPAPEVPPPDPRLPPDAAEPEPEGSVLAEGEFIEAVLTNRLAGDYTGPVNAMVSANVWDRRRRRVLVPRGTRALGWASHVEAWGQSRLAVTFHRLVLPDGRSLGLDDGMGLSQAGETGLKDRVDRHYASSMMAAGAVGVLAGLSQAASPQDALFSRTAAVRSAAGGGLSQSAMRILDRFLNRLPRITIREGHRVRIYLTSDLFVPAAAGPKRPPTNSRKGDPIP
ncbi:MAG: TrbI/VirB10 family protein [Bryobacterales bacterium]|nr:TrbI/VirB10 family protein [Bryobacterales bacterium]